MLVHTVYFYLKPDLNQSQREDFKKQVATLGTISTVDAFYLGSPAPVPARPVIDSSYDYSITCVFSGVEPHNRYQVDPIHLAFIESCRDLWTRVQVYDSEG